MRPTDSGGSLKSMNWIELKAASDKFMSDNSEGIWQELRQAVQDCCSSYSTHYARPHLTELVCKTENSHRIRISLSLLPDKVKRFQRENLTLLVEYDAQKHVVSATPPTGAVVTWFG